MYGWNKRRLLVLNLWQTVFNIKKINVIQEVERMLISKLYNFIKNKIKYKFIQKKTTKNTKNKQVHV